MHRAWATGLHHHDVDVQAYALGLARHKAWLRDIKSRVSLILPTALERSFVKVASEMPDPHSDAPGYQLSASLRQKAWDGFSSDGAGTCAGSMPARSVNRFCPKTRTPLTRGSPGPSPEERREEQTCRSITSKSPTCQTSGFPSTSRNSFPRRTRLKNMERSGASSPGWRRCWPANRYGSAMRKKSAEKPVERRWRTAPSAASSGTGG